MPYFVSMNRGGVCLLLWLLLSWQFVGAQQVVDEYQSNLKEISLPNGLRVYLYADPSAGGVYANWMVKAGRKHDPPNLPGCAEMLRRMIQTGNDTLGTTDAKREAVPLQRLQHVNDEWAKSTNKVERDELFKEMIRLSNVASEFAVPSEMTRLNQALGTKAVLSETGFESTSFFSQVPPHLVSAWLLLVKERMKMPAFRMYLHEKEKVLEAQAQYDLADPQALIDSLTDFIYHKNQYGSPKGADFVAPDRFPTISQLKDFYHRYYLPSNMAIVMVGNFDPDAVVKVLSESFTESDTNVVKHFAVYKIPSYKNKINFNVQLGEQAFNRLSFTAPPASSEDQSLIHLLTYILTNDRQNGILDTLVRNQLLADVAVQTDLYHDFSVFNILYRPQEGLSAKKCEDLIRTTLDSLKKGRFSDTLFTQIKDQANTRFWRQLAYPAQKCSAFSEWFITGRNVNESLIFLKNRDAFTKKDFVRVAGKIFIDKYISFNIRPFDSKGVKKNYTRTLPLKAIGYNRQSKFAKHFFKYTETFKTNTTALDDYKDKFQEIVLGMNQKLYFVEQKQAKNFRLVVKFQVGSDHYRSLEVITRYLKEVGTLKTPRDKWQQMMSLMGCKHDIVLNDQYFEIHIEGMPQHFMKAVELVNELVVFHQRDQIVLQRVVDQIEYERKNINLTPELLSDIVYNYLLHKSASPYKKRLTGKALERLDVLNLRDTLRRIMSFTVSFHYIGKNQLSEVHQAVSRYFQLPKRSTPPPNKGVKKLALYKSQTILFYHDPKADFAHIHFYVPGALINLDSMPVLEAFNQYFGKNEESLLAQNVVESKGLARKAEASYDARAGSGFRGVFTAHLVAEPGQTLPLIKETLQLLKNFPLDSIRIPGLKSSLINSCFVNESDVQHFTQEIEKWEAMGYDGHPGKVKIEEFQKLNIQRLQGFFKVHLKGKPIAIAIVGNKKYVKTEDLEKFGKVQYLKLKDVVTF